MSGDIWRDLPDLEAVALAKNKGWEIEFMLSNGKWQHWLGQEWSHRWVMRGREAQPKTKTVTSECWRAKNGALVWYDAGAVMDSIWTRFPAGDITGEVEQ